MFADPQSVTINAVANSLPRVSTSGGSSTYQKDDGNVSLFVATTSGKRNRHVVKLQHRKIAADPLVGSVNINYQMSATLTIDRPQLGYSIAEAKQIVDALTAWLTASTGANVTKVLGAES